MSDGPVVAQVMRAGYRLKSKVLQARDGPRQNLRSGAMAPQRDWYTTDYYKTLGVSDKATDKDLRRAYRKLAKELHPDSHPGSEEHFKAVSAAYDVLGDPEKRKEYDEVRRLGPLSNLGGFGGPAGGDGGNFNFRIDDLSDIFGGLFGRAGRSNTGRTRRGAARDGGTISRPSSTCRSRRRSTVPSRPSTSRAGQGARRATGQVRVREKRP